MPDPVLFILDRWNGRPTHALQYGPLTIDQRERQARQWLTATPLPADRRDMTLDQAIAWARAGGGAKAG